MTVYLILCVMIMAKKQWILTKVHARLREIKKLLLLSCCLCDVRVKSHNLIVSERSAAW